MSLPSENRLQIGIGEQILKEFMVIKEGARDIEKTRKGYYSRIAFNNEVISYGLSVMKKKYGMKFNNEQIETLFKKIQRKRTKKIL